MPYHRLKIGQTVRFGTSDSAMDFEGSVTGIDPNEEVARILATNPQVIVVDRGWWPRVRPRIATMIEEALAERYDLASVVYEDRGPVEVWRLR